MHVVLFDLDDTLLNPCTFTIPISSISVLHKYKKQGCVLGIVSFNASAKNILKHFKLDHLFECIICSFGDRHELYEQALSIIKEKYEITKITYFDDSKRNIDTIKVWHKQNEPTVELQTILVDSVENLIRLAI